jgi:ROK family
MEAELGRAVRVENDANLGALAEIVWGAGRGRADIVYVKVATGVGAGLVLSGRLYQGAGGTAGEIGHVTIDERGRSAAAATAGASRRSPAPRPCSSRCAAGTATRFACGASSRWRARATSAGSASSTTPAAPSGSRSRGRATCSRRSRSSSGGELAHAGDLLLDPVRDVVRRAAIAATRAIPVTAGVLGERAEVLGAVALVLRESQRFVAEPPASDDLLAQTARS